MYPKGLMLIYYGFLFELNLNKKKEKEKKKIMKKKMNNSAHHSPIHLCWGGPWPSLYKALPCFVIMYKPLLTLSKASTVIFTHPVWKIWNFINYDGP